MTDNNTYSIQLAKLVAHVDALTFHDFPIPDDVIKSMRSAACAILGHASYWNELIKTAKTLPIDDDGA